MIKIVKRELKKSTVLTITELSILVLSFLIIVGFAIDKIFALVPVLIITTVIIDWFETKWRINSITLKLIVCLCLILVGTTLIIYGIVRT
jgi:membrane-associated HD superfamily phosphohydrolase